ncbi:hypothetical protein [Streptomyces sp. NBC_01233]|uniref:hypothetical protein n=1 Tax=Streptomyces sp. NBC_01233 TaxID=2903787 RepID=UPI002E0D2B3F|nr:hypothetical protein OG332_07535 [Streptomyces sp. NBC_01233]
MSGFKLGEKVFDRQQQSRGEIVKLYPAPTVVRLMDAGGFQWIARTACCVPLRRRAPREKPPVRIPPGTAPVDCPPHELKVGDHVLAGGHLIPIADLRYRAGATRTMILRNGAVCVAERTIRVYRRY